MGNNVSSSVFPRPLASTSSVPDWALAIIVSAAAVTLLWLIAIIILILFEIFGRNEKSVTLNKPRKQLSSAYTPTIDPQVASQPHTRSTGSISLGTPPPPIPAPSRRQDSPPTPRRAASDLTTHTPEKNSEEYDKEHIPMDVLGTDRDQDEKEFKLEFVDDGSYDSSSLSSRNSSFSNQESKPVVSLSKGTGSSAGASPYAGTTDLTSFAGSDGGAGSSAADTLLTGMVLSRPVTLRQLGATIREPQYIETEFKKLPSVSISSDDLPPGTERKNRYTNVLPTPPSRVILPLIFGHPNSDYINANYIRGYRGHAKQYIATQGPLESTVEDFWRMIVDNNASIIVMATNFQERGIEKCSRYWPAQGSEEYGTVQVTLLQQATHETYNTSTLQVQPTGGVARTITHYRLTCWPQLGVPKDTKHITDFLRMIKMADCSGCAVVHCSAGIGRTGVLLACDIGIQGILQGDPKIDVLRIVSMLRQDRACMVQTKDQYRFIHQALYDVAKEERAK